MATRRVLKNTTTPPSGFCTGCRVAVRRQTAGSHLGNYLKDAGGLNYQNVINFRNQITKDLNDPDYFDKKSQAELRKEIGETDRVIKAKFPQERKRDLDRITTQGIRDFQAGDTDYDRISKMGEAANKLIDEGNTEEAKRVLGGMNRSMNLYNQSVEDDFGTAAEGKLNKKKLFTDEDINQMIQNREISNSSFKNKAGKKLMGQNNNEGMGKIKTPIL